MRNKSKRGTISMRTARSEDPALAAIRGKCSILLRAFGIVVVASYNHTVYVVPKCNRENPLGGSPGKNRSINNCPVLPMVGRMEISRIKDTGCRSASYKPHIILPRRRHACAAGGKATLIRQGRRKSARNRELPFLPIES